MQKQVKVMIQYPHPEIGKGKVNLPEGGGVCRIGDDCHFDLTGSITIRDKAEIADEVRIFTHKHKWDHSREDRGKIQEVRAVDLEICRDAFVGARTTLIGVKRIGEGAVIGAGAVLTKDVPDFEVWVGNPARKIKERRNASDQNRWPAAGED